MIGKTISHYRIIEKLGEGGMGIVYKAQDLKLDRFVALKFLSLHLTTSNLQKQRFIHEAKAASTLDHNNICNIHEIDETENGQLFISMAFYEGETFETKIKDERLKIKEIIDHAIQIASGLQKAHEKDIVHRDIKPANIMLTDDGVIKILDFGLAKLSTQTKLTKESTTLGTVSYMSPEQAKGDLVDYRTDIWSLGVILYEMLTGQLPFRGEYDTAVIYSILNETQEPVTGLRTGITPELEKIINKCLQKSPLDRYQHMEELILDLKGLKGPYSNTATLDVRQKRRFKSLLLPAATLSIFLLLLLGYLLIYPDKRTESVWENSIAVLPFDDLSPEQDQEWFCDGMTDQIITNLSKINRLKVIGRTSVMKFKHTMKMLPEIGKELDVTHILEGSIRKYGNSIRVSAQLINTQDGSHIWADDFDKELEHVFEVQDDVSLAIARALSEKLSLKEIGEIKTKRPTNTASYEYFLKANHFSKKYDLFQNFEDLFAAEDLYKKAITLDPNYLPSYTGISYLYSEIILRRPQDLEKYLPIKEAYLKIAEELDPNSAEVLYDKSYLYQVKGQPEKRYEFLRKALHVDPNHFGANQQMGIFLREIGLSYHSFRYFNRAIEVNPLGQWAYVTRGWAYFNIGDFDKAENDFKSNLEIEPNDYWTLRRFIMLKIMQKREKDVSNLLNQYQAQYPEDRYLIYYRSLFYAMQGDSVNALRLFKSTGMNGWAKVIIFSVLNKKNAAILLMMKPQFAEYLRAPRSRYLELKNLRWYDIFRSDPRFQKILANHKKIYDENIAKYGDTDAEITYGNGR